MKRKQKIGMGISASRNKWARRGRNLAHFLMSLVFCIFTYAFYGIVAIVKWLVLLVVRRKKSEPRKKEINVEALFKPISGCHTVSFDDIAGLETAKEQIMQRMVLPAMHPKEAKALKVKSGGGVLLFGPPGTGKTMLARAIASQITASFFHVTPADIVTNAVGMAEKKLSELFATAKGCKKAVIFFDDVDGLLPSRRKNNSTIMRRVISQYLIETDGLEADKSENVLLIVGATNEPEMIDPAIKRSGRFDARIYIGLPDKSARADILRKLLSQRPIDAGVSVEDLSSMTDGYSGADLKELINRAAQKAFSRNIKREKGSEMIPINRDDVLSALSEVLPSVSSEDLKRYSEG